MAEHAPTLTISEIHWQGDCLSIDPPLVINPTWDVWVAEDGQELPCYRIGEPDFELNFFSPWWPETFEQSVKDAIIAYAEYHAMEDEKWHDCLGRKLRHRQETEAERRADR